MDASPLTLRQLLWKAVGAYSPTAELLAQQYNLNRGRDQSALTARDLNPYIKKPRIVPLDDIGDVREAWKALTRGQS